MRAFLLLALLSCSSSQSAPSWSALAARPGHTVTGPPTPRSALIVVLDDVADEDVNEMLAGPWGATLRGLSSTGLRYTHAYANPVCSPSRRSLQGGGWYFDESGLACAPLPGAELPAATTTIAELAASAGIDARALFGKWHLGGQPSDPTGAAYLLAPEEHGYTTTDWEGGQTNDCGGSSYKSWKRVRGGLETLSSTYEPLEHEQAISSYIAAQSGPCLVVWNMHLAHAPFHKPDASIMPPGWTAPGLVLTNQQKYEAMLIGADWQIGRVLSQLDLDDWLVIVVGDNGTPENIAPDPNRAKTTTLERGIHVPLFMVGAGLPAGTQTRLCHIADILPTLADYWNVPVPQGIDGISLVGLQHGWVISGTSELGGDWCAVGSFSQGALLLKLRHFGTSPTTEELYNLSSDPDELSNISGSFPIAANFLRAKLTAAGAP